MHTLCTGPAQVICTTPSNASSPSRAPMGQGASTSTMQAVAAGASSSRVPAHVNPKLAGKRPLLPRCALMQQRVAMRPSEIHLGAGKQRMAGQQGESTTLVPSHQAKAALSLQRLFTPGLTKVALVHGSSLCERQELPLARELQGHWQQEACALLTAHTSFQVRCVHFLCHRAYFRMHTRLLSPEAGFSG